MCGSICALSFSALLDLPLYLANRRKILIELAVVRGTESVFELPGIFGDEIEDAAADTLRWRARACGRQRAHRRRTAARTARADRGSGAAAASRSATRGCSCRRKSNRNRSRPPGARLPARSRATENASGRPLSRATIWSHEMPAMYVGDALLRTCTPVRYEPQQRPWSPAPSSSARPLLCVRLPSSRMSSLYGSSDLSMRGSSPQLAFVGRIPVRASSMPFGTYTNAMRTGALPGSGSQRTPESSHRGTAARSLSPFPAETMRRGSALRESSSLCDLFWLTLVLTGGRFASPRLERKAVDHLVDQRLELDTSTGTSARSIWSTVADRNVPRPRPSA